MEKQEKLKELVFIALGETSVSSWSEEPKGIFQDVKVIEIGNKLVEDIITETEVKEMGNAMKILKRGLVNDPGYRIGWVANIAMAYIDSERWYKQKTGKKFLNREDKHIIANNAAEYFIDMLCKQ